MPKNHRKNQLVPIPSRFSFSNRVWKSSPKNPIVHHRLYLEIRSYYSIMFGVYIMVYPSWLVVYHGIPTPLKNMHEFVNGQEGWHSIYEMEKTKPCLKPPTSQVYPWYIPFPYKNQVGPCRYRSRHSLSPTCRASRRSSHAADRDLQRLGPQKEEEIHGKMDQKLRFEWF